MFSAARLRRRNTVKLLLAFAPFIASALLEHRIGTHAALVAATAAENAIPTPKKRQAA